MGRTLEQLIADEKPEVVAKAQALAADIMLNIHLAELREKVQKTQVEMAQALGIRQPTVAVMEKPGRDPRPGPGRPGVHRRRRLRRDLADRVHQRPHRGVLLQL